MSLRTDTRSTMKSLRESGRLTFIGGLHRSGTSLVHRCLSDHPDISGFQDTGVAEDEGQHLQSVYLPASAYGGPGLFGLHREAYLDESSSLATQDNALRILAEWSQYWDLDRPILVEKSPPNLIRTRFLQALFPRARFVVVLRHPIAVGYATQKWTSFLPVLRSLGVSDRPLLQRWIHTLVEHWLMCYEAFEADRAALERVHVLRYESFVADPQGHMDQLCRFLDLSPTTVTREIRQGVNDRYWARWEPRIEGRRSARYARWLIDRFEKRTQAFGYSLLKPQPLDR